MLRLLVRSVLLLLLVVVPWPLGARLPWASSLATLIVLSLAGAWLAARLWNAPRLSVDRIALPIIAFLAWAVLGALSNRSVYPFGTLIESAELAGYAAMMFLTAALFTGSGSSHVLTATLLVSTAAVALFGIWQHLTWNGLLFWSYEPPFGGTSPFGPFNNRNYFAGFIAVGVGPAFALALGSVRAGWRIAGGVVAAIGAGAVVLSLARAGIIAVAAGLAIALGLAVLSRRPGNERNHLPVARALGVAVLLLVAIAGLAHLTGLTDPLLARFELLTTPGYDRSVLGRLVIWSDTLEMIRDRPITGFGLDTFVWAHLRYRSIADGIPQHAHNEYLELVAETGLVGGAIAAWFLWALFVPVSRRIRRRRGDFRTDLARGAIAAWGAILVLALMDFPTVVPATNYVLAALGGVALAEGSGRPRSIS